MANIVGCLKNLDKMFDFYEEEEKLRRQYDDGSDIDFLLRKTNRCRSIRIVRNEDNSDIENLQNF